MLDLRADYIDSRDIIERLDELESLDADGELPDENVDELDMLRAINREGANMFPDWQYGETLIRGGYTFVEYAQEMAYDIGAYNGAETWPLYCIDWERAARDLQMEYAPIDIDDVEYWGQA